MPLRLPGHLLDQSHSSAAPAGPEPVPASLAPAQGQLPPKILKRPISGTFSAQAAPPAAASNIVQESERAAAETASSASAPAREGSASPPQNYALGLADNAAITDARDEADNADEGFATPRQGYEFPPLQRLRVTNRA